MTRGYYRFRNAVFGFGMALAIGAFLVICGVMISNAVTNMMENYNNRIEKVADPLQKP